MAWTDSDGVLRPSRLNVPRLIVALIVGFVLMTPGGLRDRMPSSAVGWSAMAVVKGITSVASFETEPDRQSTASSLDFELFNHDFLYDKMTASEECFREAYAFDKHSADDFRVGVMTNCGERGDEYSTENTLAAQRWIQNWQNPKDCAAVKIGLIAAYHHGGIGSTMHYVNHVFLAGLSQGYVMVYDNGPRPVYNFPWADCDLDSPDCYFLPVSNCTDPTKWKHLTIFKPEYPPRPHLISQWERFRGFAYAWQRSQTMKYLMRPNAAMVQHVTAAAKEIFPNGIPRPMAAMFVRWTDKGTESPVFNVTSYFDILDPVATSLGVKDVYIGSDDPRAPALIREQYGSRYAVYNLKAIRTFSYLQDFNHMNASSKGEQFRFALVDLYVQAHADVHVGTLSSNWCRMVDELRSAVGKTKTPFLDVDGRFIIEGTR